MLVNDAEILQSEQPTNILKVSADGTGKGLFSKRPFPGAILHVRKRIRITRTFLMSHMKIITDRSASTIRH